MANAVENQIKFGYLTYEDMELGIKGKVITEYNVCFTRDTNQIFLIDENLNPVAIKSRIRVYASTDSAIADIQTTDCTYEGELISVLDGDNFIAYTVNKFDDGEWYLSPVFSSEQVDYDKIQNAPITNLVGTSGSPIVINNLADGQYKVTGEFVSPSGTSITSIVGNIFIVETTGVNTKTIKRISQDSIFDYTITGSTVVADKYATEKYIEEQGYATESYIDAKMEAFKIAMEEYVQEYVRETVTALVREIVKEELDARYSTKEDIEDLFG